MLQLHAALQPCPLYYELLVSPFNSSSLQLFASSSAFFLQVSRSETESLKIKIKNSLVFPLVNVKSVLSYNSRVGTETSPT